MYLLDTDTIIYSLKNTAPVVENFRLHKSDPKAISIITYGELVYGARKSQQVNENLSRVHRLAELFPVFDVTRSVMDTFGDIKASLISKGVKVADFDLIIGATALCYNYTVVTNNEKHFAKIPGLSVENWLNGPV